MLRKNSLTTAIECSGSSCSKGFVAPGAGAGGDSQCLPWFHVTDYGRLVLEQSAGHPHDPTAYVQRLKNRVPSPDGTVLAYVGESLSTFRRGAVIASAVMLGVAAERVFLLVCESIRDALADPKEKADFTRLLERFAVKPKLDWVHSKLLQVQGTKGSGLPDNSTLTVTAIYQLLRSQRNDLGHPRDMPPTVEREDVFANLQIFPRFYETAEQLRAYLATNSV